MQNKVENIFKTDIIIPIGNCCLTSFFLKDNNLRKMATPFDWQNSENVNLNSYIYYFKDFSNFFKERVNLGEYNGIIASDNNDNFTQDQIRKKVYFIKDIKTEMVCMHYFPIDKKPDEFYNESFFPMMKKRFDRIVSYIKQSETIMFISFFRQDSLIKKLQFLKDFNKMFNKKYIYISVNNNRIYRDSRYSYENGKFKIIEVNAFFDYKNNWNTEESKILRKENLKRLADKILITDKINYSNLDIY